jgi:hypothetical protein
MKEKKEKCKLSGVRMLLIGKRKEKLKMLKRTIQKQKGSENKFKENLLEIGKMIKMINNVILFEILTHKNSYKKLLIHKIHKNRHKVIKIIISMVSLYPIVCQEIIKPMIILNSLISK